MTPIESDLEVTLRPVFGEQLYADVFPQRGQPLPWPAMRYTFVSAVPDSTICGDGGEDETDFRIQLFAVAATAKLRRQLRLDIQEAMRSFPTPVRCELWTYSYDDEARGYIVSLDYIVEPSTPD